MKTWLRHDNQSKTQVVGFWPSPETTKKTKNAYLQHYKALHWTYDVEVQVVSRPEEVFLFPNYNVISVEEHHEDSDIVDFVHPEKALYIVGSSTYPRATEVFKCDGKVSIKVPKPDHPLYGSQAMAIILQDRYNKHEGL